MRYFVPLSILYLRCKLQAVGVPTSPEDVALSILYLRCTASSVLARYRNASTFNSLFEMHDGYKAHDNALYVELLSILYLRCTHVELA